MSARRNQEAPEFIPIGKIVGAFGIDGRMKVEILTDFPDRFALGKEIYIKGQAHKIKWIAWHKTQVRLKLDAFTKPEQVEDIRLTLVEVRPEDRPELEEGEYYTSDLIGMKVVTTDGEELGKLEEVLDYPAHEIFRVGSIMIPAIDEFVHLIDFDEEKIVVELIPGMRGEDE